MSNEAQPKVLHGEVGFCGDGIDLVSLEQEAASYGYDKVSFVDAALAAGVDLWFKLTSTPDWSRATGGATFPMSREQAEVPTTPRDPYVVVGQDTDFGFLRHNRIAHVTDVRSGPVLACWHGTLDEPQAVGVSDLFIDRKRVGAVLNEGATLRASAPGLVGSEASLPTVNPKADRDTIIIAVLAEALAQLKDHEWVKPASINASAVARDLLKAFPAEKGQRGWNLGWFSARIREAVAVAKYRRGRPPAKKA